MQDVFPQFKPFANNHGFGFEGQLAGPRSGQLYQVRIEADETTYPQWPPNVSMAPKVGDHWVEHRGKRVLCAVRDWQPARCSFANTVLMVVRYLHEHDGVSSSAVRYPRGQDERLDPNL